VHLIDRMQILMIMQFDVTRLCELIKSINK
jgi:hypothetical protein